MDTARRLAIVIFSGVPAIIGGGIVYALFGNKGLPVVIYEILLAVTVLLIINKK